MLGTAADNDSLTTAKRRGTCNGTNDYKHLHHLCIDVEEPRGPELDLAVGADLEVVLGACLAEGVGPAAVGAPRQMDG